MKSTVAILTLVATVIGVYFAFLQYTSPNNPKEEISSQGDNSPIIKDVGGNVNLNFEKD